MSAFESHPSLHVRMSAIGGKADIPATWIFIFYTAGFALLLPRWTRTFLLPPIGTFQFLLLDGAVAPIPCHASALAFLFITPNPHIPIFARNRRSGPSTPAAMGSPCRQIWAESPAFSGAPIPALDIDFAVAISAENRRFLSKSRAYRTIWKITPDIC